MKKMHKSLLFGAVAGTFLLTACGTSETPASTETAAAAAPSDVEQAIHSIDTEASAVNWTGTMLGVKTHTGTLRFAEAELTTAGDALVGGSFVVDMSSYTMTDENYAPDGSEQGTRANLMGHLMSADFFDVENHPTAKFVITKVNGNTAEGDLTVRGVTNPEKVTDIVITRNGSEVSATGNLTFDRQKYGVAYSTGMKDMVISDDIVLQIELKGSAAMAAAN